MTFMALGGMGLGASDTAASSIASVRPASGVNARGIPTNPPNMQFRSVQLPGKGGGGWDGGPGPQAQQEPQTMVEKVGRMMDGTRCR